jgi:glutamyl-tRNA reductase
MSDAWVKLVLVGTNHRHAPVTLRERMAGSDHGRDVVERLIDDDQVGEAVGLATCNRCELYMVGTDAAALAAAATARLAELAGRKPAEIAGLLYVHHGRAAAEHLFEVASGLDSMVPGESQILAQIRDAHADALDAGSTGAVTNRLFAAALEAGKHARHATAIGAGGASVASVAAELVRERLGDLTGVRVVVVGAGRTASLVASQLHARGAAIAVANRDPARAEALAVRMHGHASGLDALPGLIAGADVVVAATTAPGFLIGPALVPAGRRRVLIDLAVPRDIDPAVADVPGQTLVDVDGLEQTVRRNIRLREAEAGRVRELVDAHAGAFWAWLCGLEAVPAITSLRALAERIRTEELDRARDKWEGMTEHDRARLDQVTRGMLAKLLHRPTVRLKQAAAEDDGFDAYADAVADLFGLDRARP